MLDDFITPLAKEEIQFYQGMSVNQWGHTVSFNGSITPELKKFNIAIVGVCEERGTTVNPGCSNGPDVIREHLYQLINHTPQLNVIDLGNIKPGDSLTDTYFALRTVVSELLTLEVVPVILGGSHDLTIAQYQGYQNQKSGVNLCVVDERLDLADIDGPLSDQNFLMKLFAQEPNFLNHFSQIGYQAYFTEPRSITTLDKLNFDCYRLGWAKQQPEEMEPVLRESNLLSFDTSALKQADAPGVGNATPNGFTSEEACQIMRYAGLNDNMSSLGLYGFNPMLDHQQQTAQVLAQMIWYFMDGYYFRKHDTPTIKDSNYLRYIVDFTEGGFQLVFWKSKKTERWWIELDIENNKQLLSCSYADYITACNEDLPDRWLKAMERSGETVFNNLLESDPS